MLLAHKGLTADSLSIKLADAYGLLYVDGKLVNDANPIKIGIVDGEVHILKVYAEDHETSDEFKLIIKQEKGGKIPQKAKLPLIIAGAAAIGGIIAAIAIKNKKKRKFRTNSK